MKSYMYFLTDEEDKFCYDVFVLKKLFLFLYPRFSVDRSIFFSVILSHCSVLSALDYAVSAFWECEFLYY